MITTATPVGYRNGSDVPAFTNEINYRPILLALLPMLEVKTSQLAALKSAAKQDGENRPVPLSFEGGPIWRLPDATSFFGCEPVPNPHTNFLVCAGFRHLSRSRGSMSLPFSTF